MNDDYHRILPTDNKKVFFSNFFIIKILIFEINVCSGIDTLLFYLLIIQNNVNAQ